MEETILRFYRDGRENYGRSGRITIPKGLRERFGDRYLLIELQDGIKLLSRPEDPVAALRNAASEEFRRASLDELREAAYRAPHERRDEP